MTDNTTATLPKFLQQKEQCVNCNSTDTLLVHHGVNTDTPDTFVRATYMCNKCKKEFGYEYSGGFVTRYVDWRDKKPVEVIKVA